LYMDLAKRMKVYNNRMKETYQIAHGVKEMLISLTALTVIHIKSLIGVTFFAKNLVIAISFCIFAREIEKEWDYGNFV